MNANTPATPGERVARIRKIRGLTQPQLAKNARLSLRTVKTVEGDDGNPRTETLAAIAEALAVSTTSFMTPGQPEHDPAAVTVWEEIRDVLYQRDPGPAGDEEPTPGGVLAALAALMPAWRASRYQEVRAQVPGLLRDALALDGDGRAARSRVLNAAAWHLTMTRQWDDALTAARLALDAAPDAEDSMAAAAVTAWCLLRQGQLAEARDLAVEWADRAEPRFSRASPSELAGWGKILLYAGTALLRDNRPGDADDALSLARAASVRLRQDVTANRSTTMTFGPAQVAVIATENASVARQPDRVLALSQRLPAAGLARIEPAQRLRHSLDVANAHAMKRQYADVVTVMTRLQAEAPEWLAQQRYARTILEEVIQRRRGPLPEDLRGLAAAVRLPL